MKLMIASDIHGSALWCRKMLESREAEGAPRLLLLGDILYHGPRNDLPDQYNPKEVLAMLNPLRQSIFCVRGNCDTEVDQMVLTFPILADYALLYAGDKLIYATHGHVYNPDSPPPLEEGAILLNGHTHIPAYTSKDTFTYINPGSVSIPKENSCHSYILLEDRRLFWKDLSTGKIYMEQTL
ncbi:MAG: phosphodiesterase [Clostridiales bacterium]|jgi:putative phosphoesterase|nr:phosphodiesterase [Clostridiales bacterium]